MCQSRKVALEPSTLQKRVLDYENYVFYLSVQNMSVYPDRFSLHKKLKYKDSPIEVRIIKGDSHRTIITLL